MSLKKYTNFIRSKEQWVDVVNETKDLCGKVVQNIDFRDSDVDWEQLNTEGTIFLGCDFDKENAINLISNGAFVYPKFRDLPYNPHRAKLYDWHELLAAAVQEPKKSIDLKIYEHFLETKYNPPLEEAMAQRIHDYSVDVALRNIVQHDANGMTQKKIVGFMGGHSTRRGSEYYIKVALAARRLAEKGFFIATGGGPGIMEAANLGAYFGKYRDEELLDAIEILSELQFDSDESRDYFASNYVHQAILVLEKYPFGSENLAIPTWFYGHEPTNLFASSIAKYFSNSIREDTLLAICLYGIVYAPGSAGTTQEIFQEAAQNHYGTFGYYSPMIFLGKKRYVEDTALYSVLHQLAEGMSYKELLYLTDDPDLVVHFIEKNPPVKV